MARIPLLIAFLGFSISAFAQTLTFTRHLHQSFDVPDEVAEISFSLPDSSFFIEDMDTLRFRNHHRIEAWAGNTILVETTISLSHGREEIVDFFVKKGRYQLNFDSTGTTRRLRENEPRRKIIRTKEGPIGEEVFYKILIPDTYLWEGDTPKRAIRKKED